MQKMQFILELKKGKQLCCNNTTMEIEFREAWTIVGRRLWTRRVTGPFLSIKC